MAYTRTTWAAADVITSAKLNNNETGLNEVYNTFIKGLAGLTGTLFPFTGSPSTYLALDLYHYTSAFTYGTAPKTSNGYFQIAGMPSFLYDGSGFPGNPQVIYEQNTSTASPTTAVTLNELFLLPAHGAINVAAWAFQIKLGTSPNGANSAMTWAATDVLCVKVAADGTETTLSTTSETTAAAMPVSEYGAGCLSKVISVDYGGSPKALAAGERLGFRVQIKTYRTGTSAPMPHAINRGPRPYSSSSPAEPDPLVSRLFLKLS